MRKILYMFIVISMTFSMCISSHAATINTDDIATAIGKTSLNGQAMNNLLNSKVKSHITNDDVEVKTFTDPQLIYRRYRVKNDDDFTNYSMFKNYSGNFAAELIETDTLHIPVIEREKIVGEYLYNDSSANVSNAVYVDLPDQLGFSTIYDHKTVADIISAANIGEPKDIRSVRIQYPVTALIYVQTDKGEYVIPTNDVYLGYYDDNDRYSLRIGFNALTVYAADELVDAYKSDLVAHQKRRNEIDENDGSYSYIDDNGEIAQTTPKPQTTQKPTDKPKPTATPKQTDKPKVTAESKATVEPTAAPAATTKPQPTADSDGWQDTITVHNTPDKGLFMSINDVRADLGGAEIFIDENDRTQMPVRAVSELLDAKVDWNEATRTVTVTRGDNVLTLEIGSKIMYKNGEPIEMDTAAVIVNDLTYIPLRYIGEALDCMVAYTTSEIPFEGRRKILTGDDVYEGFFEGMSAEEVKEILDAATPSEPTIEE